MFTQTSINIVVKTKLNILVNDTSSYKYCNNSFKKKNKIKI